MQSQWNSKAAKKQGDDPRSSRAYASRLLAAEGTEIVAFGTVKVESETLFGETQTQLYASAGDDAYPLDQSDELPPHALIHAAIPARFVDQIRTAPILAIANDVQAPSIANSVFGERVQVAPFIADERAQAEAIKALDLSEARAVLVPGAGLFSFSDKAKRSYEQAIELVVAAAERFADSAPRASSRDESNIDLHALADLRATVSGKVGHAVIAKSELSAEALVAAAIDGLSVSAYATDGDHDEVLPDDSDIQRVLWPDQGVFSFANSKDGAERLAADTRLTCQALSLVEAEGTWNPEVDDPFATQSLRNRADGVLQGKIALVSGSAAGIGLATATTLAEAGATVVGADINPEIESIMAEIGALGITVDLTQASQIESLINRIVGEYGGLDIVVSNAGIFTAGAYLQDMESSNWERSMAVNLTSHQVLMKHAIPFVKKGIDPTIIFIGSRNVNAPGAGAASYSCAKAGLTQLCRVAALELAPEGVRVNIIHPDAVFDTKLWTKEALERSAERYGLTVEQYKKRNLMKTEITSRSVGNSVVALASNAFAKTTGAQIPVDGGNDRII